MGLFEQLPYTNFHEMNLDWLLSKMKELIEDYESWKDITEQHIEQLIADGLLNAVWDPNTKTIIFDGQAISSTDIVRYLQVAGARLSLADTYAREQIDILKGNRKYIFIGDSYNTEAHHGGWGIRVVNNLKLGTDDYINSGVGGASFAGPTKFITQLETITNGLSATERELFTDIVIGGGLNDWNYSEADITSNVISFLTYARANYPNAKITMVFTGWSYQNANIRIGTLNAYRRLLQMGFDRVIETAFYIFTINTYLESDMTHPTENGMNLLGKHIAYGLTGSDIDMIRYFEDLPTTFINPSKTGTMQIHGWSDGFTKHAYKNDNVGLRFDSAPITISRNAYTVIGHSQTPAYLFEREAILPCTAAIVHNVGGVQTYTDVSGVLKVSMNTYQDYSLSFKMSSVPSNATSITDVIGIYPIFNASFNIADA